MFVSTTALAQQPSAADLESARELYREGKELRQKGDLKGALERFKAAHGYGQTPVTGIELGKTHLALGELVEAREVLLSIARMKVASDETEKSAAARQEAGDLAEQLRPRIPTLTVRVSGPKPDAQVQVLVDNVTTPVVSLASIRKVNPGDHAIIVRSSGHEEKRSVTLAEAESKEVAVEIGDASPKAEGASEPAAAPRVAEAPARDATEKKSIHVLTWIGLGVGVAGVATGTVTGILALGKAGKVSDACHGLDCPPSAKDDVDSGRTVATISTIGFAVGVVGLAAAAVGYFVLSSPKASKTARFELLPNGGIRGSF